MNNIFLDGHFVGLEPLLPLHKEPLRQASLDDKIWTYHTENFDPLNRFENWFRKALLAQEQENSHVFIVKSLIDKKVVGTTRYYDIAPEHKRLVIGFTWYHPEYWGTAINPEAKLLLLSHAFEKMCFNRVSFQADIRNTRSVHAMEKLGAKKEGILRKHIILGNGHVRDTIELSIIVDEWPEVKKNLTERLLNI